MISPRSRCQDGGEIAHRHREEDNVGGGLHTRPAEDDDDDGVGDERDDGQDRHDDPEKREDKLHGPHVGGGVDGVAGPELDTPEDGGGGV